MNHPPEILHNDPWNSRIKVGNDFGGEGVVALSVSKHEAQSANRECFLFWYVESLT